MKDEELQKMRNSELLVHLFQYRDNLMEIGRQIHEYPEEEELVKMYKLHEDTYTKVMLEVLRRMENGIQKV